MTAQNDHVKRQQEGSHLQAKEKGLEQTLSLWPSGETQPAGTPVWDFQEPELLKKKKKERRKFCYLNHSVCDILLGQP